MLTIIYDPYDGEAIPDGRNQTYVDHFMLTHKGLQTNLVTTISTALTLDEFRLRVARGEITPSDVRVVFQGKDIWIDSAGKLSEWPPGLGDHMSQILRELAKHARNKAN